MVFVLKCLYLSEVNNFRNDERVSVAEAIDMYTSGAAFATMKVNVFFLSKYTY